MAISERERKYQQQEDEKYGRNPTTHYSGDWTSSGAKPARRDQLEDGRPGMTDLEWAKILLSEILAAGIQLPEELRAGSTTFSKSQLIEMMAVRD